MNYFQITLKPDGSVLSAVQSNVLVEGALQVDAGTFSAISVNPLVWAHVDGDFVRREPPTPPLPVPSSVTDRQFFHELAVRGLITEDEALDAVATGALPAVFKAAVDALPADQQFAAKMLLKGATTFERAHPFTEMLRTIMGISSEAVDDLFRSAATR